MTCVETLAARQKGFTVHSQMSRPATSLTLRDTAVLGLVSISLTDLTLPALILKMTRSATLLTDDGITVILFVAKDLASLTLRYSAVLGLVPIPLTTLTLEAALSQMAQLSTLVTLLDLAMIGDVASFGTSFA